jgi:taurine transport system substrate-binding protein
MIARLLSVAVAVALAVGGAVTVRGQGTPERIRIGWQPALSRGTYVAMLQKIYEQEGLAPEHIKFEAGPPMFAALSSGDLDVAYMSVYPVIFGLAQGLDIKIFVVPEESATGNGLVARGGSNIKSIVDQKGKRIAVTFGSAAHFGVIRSLKKAALKESEVTILDMPPSVIQAAFIRGDIDGTWIWEPWLVKLEKEGGTVIANYRDIDVSVPTAYVGRGAFLRERPAAVQKFIAAYDRATKVTVTPELTDRMGNIVGLSRDMTTKALNRFGFLTIDKSISGNVASMGTWETRTQTPFYKQVVEFATFLHEQKKIKQVPDIAAAIDPRPVEQYLKTR